MHNSPVRLPTRRTIAERQLTIALALPTLFALSACDLEPELASSEAEAQAVDLEADGAPLDPSALLWSRGRSGVRTIADLPTTANDAISVGRWGQVYVSNAGVADAAGLVGTQVFRIGPFHRVSVAADGLAGPLGNATDRRGNLYVSNFNDGTVRRRPRRGAAVTLATLAGSGGGLAFDSRQRLFGVSYTGNAVYAISPDGELSVYSDDPLLAGPAGIAFGDDDRLYVANYNDGKILEIDADGAASVVADLGAAAGFNIGYITFARGCIFATSLAANQIFAVSPAGSVSVLAGTGDFGTVDGDLDQAQFAFPNGIAANRWETTLYVSEYGSTSIRALRIPRNACPDE